MGRSVMGLGNQKRQAIVATQSEIEELQKGVAEQGGLGWFWQKDLGFGIFSWQNLDIAFIH